jgi:HD-GYP domain-containing protein (c-di-GMP phosphodiesterase class II)
MLRERPTDACGMVTATDRSSSDRWASRRLSARALRWGVVVVPFIAATVTAVAVSLVLPVVSGWWLAAGRLVVVGAIATVVMRVVDSLMRRILPLAALLDLSLTFPDSAPSRMKMAMRAASAQELGDLLDRYQRVGADDAAAAAERLLELVAALSRHDRITRGHSERVRAYAQMIGEEMGLSGDDLDRLRWAGLIHDIGKLRIDGEILNKPGRLTDEEFAIIKTHPALGAELAAPLADWLGESVLAVAQHHEKWDGTGYPNGISGHAISLPARIVAVADVFDVITSVRSYQQPRSAHEARAELARCAGTHFDPAVVRSFLNLSMGSLRRVMGPLSWATAWLVAARPVSAAPSNASGATGAAGAGSSASATTTTTTIASTGSSATTTVASAASSAATATSSASFSGAVSSVASSSFAAAASAGAAATSATVATGVSTVVGIAATGLGALVAPVPVVADSPPAPPAAVVASTTTTVDPAEPVVVAGGSSDGAPSAVVASGVDPVPVDPTSAEPLSAAPEPGAAAATAEASEVVPDDADSSTTVPPPTPAPTTVPPRTVPPRTVPTTTAPPKPVPSKPVPATTPSPAAPSPIVAPPVAVPPVAEPVEDGRLTGDFLFAAPEHGDSKRPSRFTLEQRKPQNETVPNLDADLDGLPGLTLFRADGDEDEKDSDGKQSPRARFVLAGPESLTIDGTVSATLFARALLPEDSGEKEGVGIVRVSLAVCDETGGTCKEIVRERVKVEPRLDDGWPWKVAEGSFTKLGVDFGVQRLSFDRSMRLEVWVAVDEESQFDIALAIDSIITPASVLFG